MLNISNLKVNYGGIEAVKGISFTVPEKSIVTLIGANGAGKSTTLRAIAGLVPIKGGTIEFLGKQISGLPSEKIVGTGITLVPEGRRVFPDLTVLENIKIGAYLRKDDLTDDINWVYDLFPRLKERSWQLAGTLSGGEQQMLAVGRALMSRPKLIMMDEPSLCARDGQHHAGRHRRRAARKRGRESRLSRQKEKMNREPKAGRLTPARFFCSISGGIRHFYVRTGVKPLPYRVGCPRKTRVF